MKTLPIKCPGCNELKETEVFNSLEEMLPTLTEQELDELLTNLPEKYKDEKQLELYR